MNNIYKVIWSKAKNCYVVASEIARSHTKSATGSEKIGGVTKRSLLASLMALSLLCGGLGVASAADGTVHVQDIAATATTKEVYTTDKVYTKTETDGQLALKANATDVAKNTENIATNKENIHTLDGKLANLTTAVNGKADAANVYTKNDAEAKLALKANAEDVYSKTDADARYATKNALDGKADITYVDQKFTDAGNNVDTKLRDYYNKDTVDGKIAHEETARDTAITKAIEQERDARNTAITTAINGEVTNRDKAIHDAIELEKTNRDAAITIAKTALQDKITEEETARKETDTAFNTRLNTAEGKIGANETAIGDLKAADTALEGEITKNREDIATLNGKVATAEGNITDLKAKDTDLEKKIQTNADNIQTNRNAIAATDKRTAGIDRIDATSETTIEKNVKVDNRGNVTAEGQLTGKGVDAGDGAITTKGAVNAGSLNVTDASNLKGDVTMGNKLTVTGDTTLQKTDVDGALSVTGESSLKNTTVGGTLDVTGATTLKGTLTAEKDATFEKNVTVQNDLTVNGKLNVDKISMKNDELKNGKKHDSATTITADEISNLAKVTEQGNTTESQFTHNEKGTFNHARDGNNADWKESNSNVTADGVSNKMTDSDGNRHTYYQTAAETKEQLVNGDKSNFEKKTAKGNTISITEKDADGNLKSSLTNTQTVNGEKTSVTNKDSSSTINQGADQIRNYVASTDGTKSSTEVKADGITNTSDGTITNDANHIENKANTMDTTVTGKATENYGELETTVNGNQTTTVTGNVKEDYKKDLTTTVGGNELHEVTGTKTENVTGKVTENYNGGQETNVKGDQDIKVSGTRTTTATDIKRNASSGMIDTIDNDYGTNTETKVAGKTTTEVSIKGTDESGTYIRGATEARDYIINGTLSNSETKTAEATSTEITDGNGKTSSTIQDVTQISGSVTDGTNKSVSNVKANSIDSIVTGEGMSSVINQKKDSIQSAVGDGTSSTVILQDKDNVTIASSNGAVGIVGKDIVNNAQNTITNTVGTANRKIEDGKIIDTAGDFTVTTENGNGTTFAKKTGSTAYSTEVGAPTDTNIAGNHITTGRVDANELGVSDKDGANTADLSVKAGEGVKASAGNGTTTGSLDVTAKEVGFSVKDDASGKGSTFKQRIDAIMGNVKTDAGESEVTQKGDEITSVVGKGEATNSRLTQKKGSLEAAVTDGTGNENASAATATSSANTIKSGSKANTVISTADGTSFINSDAMTPVTGASGAGTAVNTTIKGNTITTGKVTMDYAEVMKDLGVHGNANITGKTTTGSLEVKGESKLTGNVTMENNAIVGNDLTVKGITTTKTLKVTENAEINGNATIKGDVTAKSYKVGDKTYINADGINANNQKITNVADGSISEGSKDAVNGGQLYTVKNDLEGKVNKVGANAAAMANLHPMEFDPDSKWNIAAAIGNYGSETAAALGAFYRPNDNVMVNLSTAFGTGENMVGGGVSVRLGKGGNKLSREETNALKAQVADLTARMDALLSVLNPNMSKDFPDVPENHWAYEAVSRLAGNDIVQGYPDGEFHGERTMTRYEMAEIIYNALSRGAEAEKELVEEFKPELQAMAASEKATAEKAEG